MLVRNGPAKRPRQITGVRELTKADLPRLLEPRAKAHVVQKLKDSHHHLAKLFAAGLDVKQVAIRTGYSYHRVKYHHQSPAFQQLIAEYRAMVNEQWLNSLDDYWEIATGNMVRAELQLADKLGEAEEAGETLPVRDLIAISRDAADRFGYGKRNTQVNVNADFASMLDRAIKRSGSLKAIETPQVESSGAAVSVPLDAAPLTLPEETSRRDDTGSPLGVVAPFIRRRA
jgi:hypothetical protein